MGLWLLVCPALKKLATAPMRKPVSEMRRFQMLTTRLPGT